MDNSYDALRKVQESLKTQDSMSSQIGPDHDVWYHDHNKPEIGRKKSQLKKNNGNPFFTRKFKLAQANGDANLQVR